MRRRSVPGQAVVAAAVATALALGVAADVTGASAPVATTLVVPDVQAAGAVAVDARDAAPPRIVVEPDTVDLGPVRDDDDAAADFVVRNTGGRELHIERIEPG